MPGWARSTRAMCSACAPVMVAVASSQCSAIQRRRVIAVRVRFLCLRVYSFCENTEGDAECVPLSIAFWYCCLWLDGPLLLLCGLLCGRLFRGCLLGCFLCCHLPILPFRWFASILQYICS